MARSALMLLVSSVVGLSACTAADEASKEFVTRDSLGVVIAENRPAVLPSCEVSSEPRVTIGTAEGDEPYQLYRVFGATKLSDGRIALVNQGSQELRFYDSRGEHLMSAGRGGDGPGEFRAAFFLWALPGDTIWVGDYGPLQFLVFGPDGQWVRTVRPKPEYPNSPGVMSVLSDGRLILGERQISRADGPGFHPRSQPVVIHSADGTLLDTIGVFPNGRWGQVGDNPRGPFLYPLFESFARIDASGTTLVLGHGSEARLLVYSMEGTPELVRIITWDPGDRSVGPGDVAAEYARLRAQYADLDPGTASRLVEPLVSDERPVADILPAFGGLHVGRDGTIWVREYPQPGESEAQDWISFDAEGRMRCSASLGGAQLLEFGRDYVLMLDRDDLGVERVLQFDLGQPLD